MSSVLGYFSEELQCEKTQNLIVSVLHKGPHSIILASCKPGFRPGLQPGFRQVCAGLRHAFDTLSTFFVENLVANLLHQSRHVAHVRSSLGFKQVCSWLLTCL